MILWCLRLDELKPPHRLLEVPALLHQGGQPLWYDDVVDERRLRLAIVSWSRAVKRVDRTEVVCLRHLSKRNRRRVLQAPAVFAHAVRCNW